MRRWLFILILVASSACGRQVDPSALTATLPALGGSRSVALNSCPTPKCLTVYVAPWCGVCRASTGLFKALRDYLAARNVATRIIVGKDSPDAVRAYAADFGPDTLLDPGGEVALRGGVPQLIATDASGRILKTMAGVPGIYQAPYPEPLLRKFAEYLDLAR